MDTKALQFESRFSLAPNSLGYCGKNTAAARFKHCILTGECDEVAEEVKHFIVLYPYLRLLAAITGQPELSYDIIEGYWLGNDILRKAKPEHYDLLLEKFLEQGIPEFFVEELKQKKPKVFIPSHLFQVLHVGVGRASGAVPFNIDTINSCMIRWGRVEKVVRGKITVKLHSLHENGHSGEDSQSEDDSRIDSGQALRQAQDIARMTNNSQQNVKYMLTTIKEVVPFDENLLGKIEVGDVIAVHWNMVIKKLTKDEVEKLEYWTEEVLANI